MIYPPYIEGTLPAITDNGIKIPFEHSPAIGDNNIYGYEIRLQPINNNIAETFYITVDEQEIVEQITNTQIFQCPIIQDLQYFNFYKVQLSYILKEWNSGTSNWGPGIQRAWSTFGITKFTYLPEVYIEDLEPNVNTTPTYNSNINVFKGHYSCPEDLTETVYSYRFTLKDEKNNIIVDTGELLNYKDEDINSENESFTNQISHTFELNYDLDYDKVYILNYWVKTVNGIELTTPNYLIVRKPTIPPIVKMEFDIISHPEEGMIEITVNSGMIQVAGNYNLLRADEKDNYRQWSMLDTFIVYDDLSIINYKDYAVEHNIKYKYAIQQYNSEKTLYSDRLESDVCQIYFEHMYLFDGERQLAIKFNPKVSSFKTTVLESKTDTIGGKYPVFFRNGATEYKELPISGLITYWNDNEELFMSKEELGFNNPYSGDGYYPPYPSTNLTDDNIVAERKFKLAVMDWLNNGKPKVFKSPTEGNYIVRLMNVSLSPNEQLGRMLHTFSAIAYEIADYNIEELIQFNLIKQEVIKGEVNKIQVATETLYSVEPITILAPAAADEGIISFTISQALEGQKVTLTYIDNNIEEFFIGTTGFLRYSGTSDTKKIKKIKIELKDGKSTGTINYTYKHRASQGSDFDKITRAITNNELREFNSSDIENNSLEVIDLIETTTDTLKYSKIAKIYQIIVTSTSSEIDGLISINERDIIIPSGQIKEFNYLKYKELEQPTKLTIYKNNPVKIQIYYAYSTVIIEGEEE